jgi:YYY domain-containing protein
MMASRPGIRPQQRGMWWIALTIVFLAALAVRLYGINWDDGTDLHPDELFITKFVLSDRIRFDWPQDLGRLLDPATSPLNPRSADPQTGVFREFAYGALPLWVTDATAWGLSRVTGTDWNSTERSYLVGRALSAFFSALTVLPVAALGAAVGGRTVGVLAALFAALAPMSIQLAHFFTTDSWLAFFVAVALLAAVTAARIGSVAHFAWTGVALGLAMATKGSVFSLAGPVAVAVAVDAHRRFTLGSGVSALRATLARCAVVAAAAAAAFFAFEPYALLRPDAYLHSLSVQADIASGSFDVPFTRVYGGTVPLVYQLEQFLRWGYGPVAGVLAVMGLALLAIAAVGRRSSPALILISWVAAYGGVILLSEVKFLRYLEPLAPVLAVAAGLALHRLSLISLPGRLGPPRQFVPAAALLAALAWTGAFVSIYAHENTRLAASRWIYAEIPPGSTLTAAYWDDALPRALSYALSPPTFGFATVTMDLYRDRPPPEASDAIFDDLSRADYVIQSSQRVEAATRAMPWRYPVQGRHFDQLERGSLGFERRATFARPPSIGHVPIDDRGADESFINYDHPRVAIYARTGSPSRERFDAAMSWALQRPWFPAREPAEPTLLLDGPVGENPSVNDARWSGGVTGATPAAIAVWVLLLVALLLVGRPLARLLLPGFPDQGWGLARTIALVIAAYAVWLGASLELFRFRAVWVVVALMATGGAGWLLWRRFDRPALQRRANATRMQVHAEAAFWVVFLLFLAFRLVTPDGWHPFWGGEKPMEFAQINAIGRSAFFPPYDPWYADGYVNYYYYGFYLMAFLFKAVGMPAEMAFNLGLPTVMGLIASGGFSVAAALARGLTRSARLAMVGGWCGVVALVLLGNLTALRGFLEGGAHGADAFLFWTWDGSRAIDYAITEFPFFSGLYADLHAHVIALPLTIAAIALCAEIAMHRPFGRRGSDDRAAWIPAMIRLAVLALLLGSLSATNAWDVPVYAALAAASVLMATDGIASWRMRGLVFGGVSIGLGLAAWLFFLPFHRHFVALFGTVALVRDPTDLLQFLSHFGGLLVVCAIGLTVMLLSSVATSIHPGTAWIALGSGVLGVIVLGGSSAPVQRVGAALVLAALAGPPVAAALLTATRQRAGDGRWRMAAGLVLVGAAGVASVVADRAVFGLALALGAAAAGGWLMLPRRAERFLCVLLAAGFFTTAGVEVLVVADDLIGSPWYRMNTVFKFYNQVWVLLALSAAAVTACMARAVFSPPVPRPHGSRARFSPSTWARLGIACSIAAALGSLAYPVLATGPRLELQFTPGTPSGSLDALAWMREGVVPVVGDLEVSEIGYAGDLAAIEWLTANVDGTPVIAEASIGPYRCNGSRISAATGLPTIIGWERHQQQQRYPDTLPARVADVRTLYTSENVAEKADILRRYNVEYVVVGELERFYPIANNECSPTGSAAGIAAFEDMLGTTLAVAHAAGGTTIYRVLPLGAD